MCVCVCVCAWFPRCTWCNRARVCRNCARNRCSAGGDASNETNDEPEPVADVGLPGVGVDDDDDDDDEVPSGRAARARATSVAAASGSRSTRNTDEASSG